jgi:hypothetical protein
MLLKMRSVSALIAGINSTLNAISVSCVEPEFINYIKQFLLINDAVSGPVR